MKSIQDIIKGYWKTISWSIIILILSFIPGETFEPFKFIEISFQDLVIHFIIYAVFTGLFIYDFEHGKSNEKYSTRWWIYPLVASSLLGFFTEIVQHYFIEGRNGDPVDFITNLFGSVAMAVVYCKFRL